ncbi:hypothetical protein [Nocardia sp. NPDC050710]|uniref:hypothetical protein n=1 Tax=Nocardia sp. NPDC050710 TaxID=3157220 RepID=UPI00340F312B
MSTAIRDITTATTALASVDVVDNDVDSAFDTVPKVRRPRRVGLRAIDAAPRSLADRRPRGSRPGDAVELYRRGPVRTPAVRHPRGAHPMEDRVEQAQLGFAVLAVAALLSALVVTALIGLAHWRAGTFHDEAPATVPGVVERQSIPADVLPR